MSIHCVLCDIEGTTTSISFVHDVLFPVSREQMREFISHQWNDAEVSAAIEKLADEEPGMTLTPESVANRLLRYIDADVKNGVLKFIQGKIWKIAYEAGRIRGHIYPDVPEIWEKWKKEGIKIAIYSSGSVEAQKLIFGYSSAGDLNHYLSAYFDTAIGGKKEPASYRKIAEELNLDPSAVLFLSDVSEELDAAVSAGMSVLQLRRPDNKGFKPGKHIIAENFHEITFPV